MSRSLLPRSPKRFPRRKLVRNRIAPRLESLEDRAVPAVLSAFLTTEHVDLNVGYTGGATGTWSLQPRDADNAVAYPPDEALLYVGDNPQSRVTRPSDPAFDFIGVGPGETFYRAPQSQNPELIYLGFAGYGVTPSEFDRYNPATESKGRVSGTGPWIKVSLVDVKHFTPEGQPGSGDFSVWQGGDTGANVLMSSHDDNLSNPNASGLDTTDGIGQDDAIWIIAGGHIHYNWGFAEKGRYEVKLKLSGYLNDGNTTQLGQAVESEPITLYFSVGSVGELEFDASSYTVNESAGTASVTVRRVGGSDGRISVEYATSDGTASAGADYLETTGVLTFNDQETVKTITIPITDDTLVEGNETVQLTLSKPKPPSINNYLIDHEDDDNGLLGSQVTATLTILDNDAASNTPPTISDVSDRTIAEDTATEAIAFTVGDAQTAPGDLIVTAISSNPALVPTGNIVLGGSGANRTVTVTPLANQSGTTTITLTITDAEGLTATDTFVLTVNPVNDAPIANPQSVVTDEDTAKAITLSGTDLEAGPLSYVIVVGPTHGTLSGTGADLTYTPDPNYHGPDNFTFKVNDGTLDSAVVTVSITVNAVNDAPMAIAQSVMVDEDTATAITLSGSDVENSPLTYIVVSGPSHGTLGGTAPNLIYTRAAGYSGPDSFTFKVNDGSLDSAVVTVSISVEGANTSPTIGSIAGQTIDEDTATAALPFTVDDAETPVGSLVMTASSSNPTLVPVGNIVFGGSGADRTVTINPAANQSGTADITLIVTDSDGATASMVFRVTVNSLNDLPTLSPVSDVVMDEDGDITIPFTVGDAETAAGSLTVTRASSNAVLLPTSRLTLGGSGANRTLRIRPNPNQFGEGTVTLTVRDSEGATSTWTFKVTVNPVDDPPIATDDSVFVLAGVTTTLPDLLANDRTLDEGQTFTLSGFTSGAHGVIAAAGDGLLSYTPEPGFRGFDSFTYTIIDGDGDIATATVTVAVGVVDLVHTDLYVNYVGGEWYSNIKADFSPQQRVDSDEAVLFANPSTRLTLPALPAAFSFIGASAGEDIWLLPQSQAVNALWLGFSSEGSNPADLASSIRLDLVSFSGPGHFSMYDTDSFGNPRAWMDTADGLNSASDAKAGGNSADFYTLFVNGHSHLNWTFTKPGRYVIGLRPTALINRTDAEGNPIQVSSTGPVALYTIDVDALTGVPLIENPPLARDDTAAVTEDAGPVPIAVLTNDSSAPDPNEDLVVSAVTQGAHGVVTIAADRRSILYTPAPDFNGVDVFTYTVADEHGGIATATVTVNVAAINDTPVATADSFAVSAGNVVRGNLLFNDRDVDGDLLSASLSSGPLHGTVSLAADGSFVYIPGPSFAGTDAFAYTVTDPTGASATATVTVTGSGSRDFEAIVTEGHTDVGIGYEDGSWDLHVHSEELDAEYEPGFALLFVGPQAERSRPADSRFEFLGVGAGETFWQLPHSPPNPELLQLGFGTEEIDPGTFRDGRVRIQLKAVNGPGHVSVWRSTDTGPEVFMSTADGISTADLFTALTGGHEDLNWGFSARGRYEVTFQAWGYLDDGDDVPDSSEDITYYFSVDNLGRLQLDAPTYSVGEDGAVTVTVRRVGGSDGPLAVEYAAAGGSATSGTDFAPFGGLLAFLDGETEKTFSVIIYADSIAEGNETVLVALAAPGGSPTQIGTPAQATLTIVDDDPPPVPADGTISGYVFIDSSNNGLRDSGEAGVAGVWLLLTGSDDRGPIEPRTVLTGADGSYRFEGLRPGTYRVTEAQPDGLLDGRDSRGPSGVLPESHRSDVVDGIALPLSGLADAINFGELRPGRIGGSVYEDLDGDGLRRDGEPGIAGVIVTLTGTDDLGPILPRTVLTDADGTYWFGDLRPGSYTVRESQPSGFIDGFETSDNVAALPGSSGTDAIPLTLAPGQTFVENHFGEVRRLPNQGPVAPEPATAVLSRVVNRRSIVLFFGSPIDAARASALSNYRLTTVGAAGRPGSRNGRPVRLQAASYNAGSRFVRLTLAPRSRLVDGRAYRLEVDRQVAANPAAGLVSEDGTHGDYNVLFRRGRVIPVRDADGDRVRFAAPPRGFLELHSTSGGQASRLYVRGTAGGTGGLLRASIVPGSQGDGQVYLRLLDGVARYRSSPPLNLTVGRVVPRAPVVVRR